MNPEGSGKSGGAAGAFSDVLSDLSGLIQNEIALAKAEAKQSTRMMLGAVIEFVIAALIATVAIFLLAQAAVHGLIAAGLEPAWAYLALGAAMGLLCWAFAAHAGSVLCNVSKGPARSARNLKQDFHTFQTMGNSDGT